MDVFLVYGNKPFTWRKPMHIHRKNMQTAHRNISGWDSIQQPTAPICITNLDSCCHQWFLTQLHCDRGFYKNLGLLTMWLNPIFFLSTSVCFKNSKVWIFEHWLISKQLSSLWFSAHDIWLQALCHTSKTKSVFCHSDILCAGWIYVLCYMLYRIVPLAAF